jgi:hypothetical protein
MERYRNIILQSAREFKLHERHIAHIESFDYIKSRTPDQYYRFSCPPRSVSRLPHSRPRAVTDTFQPHSRTAEYLYTPDRLAALLAELAEKRAAGGEVRTTVTLLGDKVLRLDVSKEAADQFLPFMPHVEGKDFALWYCGAINEPSLPQAHSVEELTDRHYAWVEDQVRLRPCAVVRVHVCVCAVVSHVCVAAAGRGEQVLDRESRDYRLSCVTQHYTHIFTQYQDILD